MELSARQFADLVHHLKGPSRFGGPGEQRRSARVDQQSRLTIAPLLGGQPQPPAVVEVKNLSARGLGFVRDQPMEPGTPFVLNLPRPGDAPAELLCTVARCEKVAKAAYFIGAEFTTGAAASASTPAQVAAIA